MINFTERREFHYNDLKESFPKSHFLNSISKLILEVAKDLESKDKQFHRYTQLALAANEPKDVSGILRTTEILTVLYTCMNLKNRSP